MTKRQHSLLKPIEDVFTFWDVLTPDERNFLKNTYSVQHYNKTKSFRWKATHLPT